MSGRKKIIIRFTRTLNPEKDKKRSRWSGLGVRGGADWVFEVERILHATHETNKIIAKFNEGALVDASEFTRTIKRVRGQMIQKKNEMRGNSHENRNIS